MMDRRVWLELLLLVVLLAVTVVLWRQVYRELRRHDEHVTVGVEGRIDRLRAEVKKR